MSEHNLPRRKLGSTGLQPSVLSFGASPLGNIFGDLSEEVRIAAVHEAFKLGMNYFDTSPFYGDHKSELVLGKALTTLPRDQIIVATKVGRFPGNVFDFSAERVTRSVLESLERLQLSYIDVIQTHDIEFGSLDQVVTETLPALQKLKEQGLVRHIGITGLPLKIYRTVLDRAAPGSVDLILSYCHHCLNDKTLDALIPYLQSKGVGIINASILSMGQLTKQGPPDWHPAPTQLKEATRKAAQHAERRGVDISKLAIMDALQNRHIATHLVGLATPEQVRENVATARQALGLDPRPDQALEDAVLAEVKEILEPVQGMTWPSGRPENN
ncbi:hypothetical protein WJX72_003882 [[Myrmecia] bisecta]|uniref:NADP-dependent oxidoreductase domain-containing protein n=1 Tax=[Myrmecia] bisecta TaxID=41462 RepID=A0AAW1Q534_9CHLO